MPIINEKGMFHYSKREALSSCRFVTFPEGAFMLLLWKATHLLGVTSLPAEGGGLRSKTEGECGTFKSAITIVYAFSLSRLRRQRLAAARSRSGSDSHLGCHSIPSRRFTTSRKEPLCYSCGKQPHLHNTLSLPAEGGGLRSKTEGECGTFKSAITIVYAFSFSRLRRQLPPGRSLYVTLVESNSLVGGVTMDLEPIMVL